MVTLAVPVPELAAIPPPGDDTVAVAVPVAVEPPDSDFFSDEQPDSPAMMIAAPPTATTNPRCTTVLLQVVCGPSTVADHPEQYGVSCRKRRGIGRNVCPSIVNGRKFGVMETLRTPADRFRDIPEFPYTPSYSEINDGDGGRLRVSWVQEGPANADPVLLLHGEPSWSFLYRRMIPILTAAGHRVVCPDLVGFGRSDKPARIGDHSYARHVEWMRELVCDVLDLRRVTLVGQDWGGLIGLRLAAEHPDRFARIVVANTGLPTGDIPMPEIWWRFRAAIQKLPTIDVGRFVASGCRRPVSDAVRAAYDAPFPDDTYCAGPRAMPGLVPTAPDDPASAANRSAWN